MTALRPPPALADRVVVDESGCWIWTGARTTNGYGHMRVNGGFEYTHRLSYELLVGPIPDQLQIDHLCRVKACCNPVHLEPVTAAENTRRSKSDVCPAQHPYDEENTYTSPRGERRCRACARVRERDRRRPGRAA